MNPIPDFEPNSPAVPALPKRSFWQKLGGGSLSISLVLHGILLAIGVVWVFQIIPAGPGKVVDFMPKSGGGGSPAAESKEQLRRVQMVQPALAKVSALDAISNLVLPEPEATSQMNALGAIGGALSKGMGGLGIGLEIGGGFTSGLSDGKGTKNPFGMASVDRNALVGTFYDLKQTSDRKPTEMTDDEMRTELRDIVRRGFKEKVFEKYFKAPRTLYQNKLHIPIMPADAAPAAFECEKEVQPKRWIVAYRGAVKAPKSGRFRFVGASDDLLVVRFNNRPVFDYGYTIAGTGTHGSGRSDEMEGTKKNAELAKDIRKLTPMQVPISFYKYTQTPKYNRDIGGMAIGPEFEVKEGETYPIEIMIGEIPGGFFSVSLLIEEIGANYQKDPGGSPILPLFRLDNSQPSPDLKGEAPPFDPNGPVWKSVPSSAPADI